MDSYTAPVEDMAFIIDELLDIEHTLGTLPAYAELGVGPDLTTAMLDEAARLAGNALAPLRRVGDEQPAVCRDGAVQCSPGYEDAIGQLAAGGWYGTSAPIEHGGQGLPELYSTAVNEMWNGADMALALQPFLSTGAALAISAHGTDEQKRLYLEKIYAGAWSGTMNLTESGAGSDLGVIKTTAVPEGDHYLIRGQKIYITWGDHQGTENIVHLVLAKLPGAPAGGRGISLFIVPKYLPDADGNPGQRNDVYPVSCEHKLGIHGSPTCVMAYGDKEGAVGYLLGEENNGLACMFTMMNEARLKVGLQALGAADGALQKAMGYARERVQGGVPIIEHPDVKRMLMTMRALTEAGRAFAYTEAHTMDRLHAGPASESGAMQTRINLMIPVIKGWLSEIGVEIASLGVQVHGGMGYVEETGAAQYLRDIRITSIYEGTNGIQAADLVTRKLGRDKGGAFATLMEEVRQTLAELEAEDNTQLKSLHRELSAATADTEASAAVILEALASDVPAALGVSFDFLMQMGYLMGGWHIARSALLASRKLNEGDDRLFLHKKISTAVFYCEAILPRCAGHARIIANSSGALQDMPVDWV